ncbi:hypothetical protein [Nonomuraea jiangxiensis]|uniref:Uncharacterized protein n=1 Tax=Nonomuraea jiangxiensis TaxID=633440 RepID=A0A1G7ZIE8_9ACTN|nr:hypothetical protein [Nonomuraea jiangxiensis]SDH08409.1 hypothetical protein SAMN05421869_101423 [Nonomuraea jiangxiensis]
MASGSLVGYGGGVAAAALSTGHLWLVGLCAVIVLGAAFLVRFGFRRGKSPWCR